MSSFSIRLRSNLKTAPKFVTRRFAAGTKTLDPVPQRKREHGGLQGLLKIICLGMGLYTFGTRIFWMNLWNWRYWAIQDGFLPLIHGILPVGIAKWGAHPSRASAYGLMFVGRNSIPSQFLRCSDLRCLYDMTYQVQVHKWLTARVFFMVRSFSSSGSCRRNDMDCPVASFHPIDWFLDYSVGARDQQGSAGVSFPARRIARKRRRKRRRRRRRRRRTNQKNQKRRTAMMKKRRRRRKPVMTASWIILDQIRSSWWKKTVSRKRSSSPLTWPDFVSLGEKEEEKKVSGYVGMVFSMFCFALRQHCSGRKWVYKGWQGWHLFPQLPVVLPLSPERKPFKDLL